MIAFASCSLNVRYVNICVSARALSNNPNAKGGTFPAIVHRRYDRTLKSWEMYGGIKFCDIVSQLM